MKKLLFFLAAITIIFGCSKVNETQDDPIDKYNGYGHLKTTGFSQPLMAGQHIEVGTVFYEINDDDPDNIYFKATYDCSASGWLISETHMYAGLKKFMPVNKKKANPKIGRFPFKGTHSNESIVTYTIPIGDLPNYQDAGFVVATHAVVNNPEGGDETAWGEGNYSFTDKDWGWYETYYEQATNKFSILYGTELSDDSLYLYHINITTGSSDLILADAVGDTDGTYDGTAFDVETSYFFFTNYETGELMINPLNDEAESFSAGELDGIAASASFYDDEFYYVDQVTNNLSVVSFDSDWQISSETVISTITSSVVITDIAMDPTGENIYMVGNVDDGTSELISYNIATDMYVTTELEVGQNTSIAYGGDGILYAVTSADETGEGFATYEVDTSTGVATLISENEEEIIIEEQISDISRGPLM